MRIALLSDIHSNFQALQACLRHAKKQGVDRFAVLGDLVGYGGDPVAVVERVEKMQQDGAIVLSLCKIMAGRMIQIDRGRPVGSFTLAFSPSMATISARNRQQAPLLAHPCTMSCSGKGFSNFISQVCRVNFASMPQHAMQSN